MVLNLFYLPWMIHEEVDEPLKNLQSTQEINLLPYLLEAHVVGFYDIAVGNKGFRRSD